MSDDGFEEKRMGSAFYSKAGSKATLIEVRLHVCHIFKLMARTIYSTATVQIRKFIHFGDPALRAMKNLLFESEYGKISTLSRNKK